MARAKVEKFAHPLCVLQRLIQIPFSRLGLQVQLGLRWSRLRIRLQNAAQGVEQLPRVRGARNLLLV